MTFKNSLMKTYIRMNRPVVLVFLLLTLPACQPNPQSGPTTGPLFNFLSTPTQIPIPPSWKEAPRQTPTPVPCTQNPPEIQFLVNIGSIRREEAQNVTFQNISIQGKGFLSNEFLHLNVQGHGSSKSIEIDTPRFQVKNDGSFTFSQSLQLVEPDMSWQVMAIHERGAACVSFHTGWQTGTATPTNVTIPMIPTVDTDNVWDLIMILYVSDPGLPQYDPQSIQYAQFTDILEKLSAMGPKAINAASHIAVATTFPRPEAVLAAKTLISLGPEITTIAIAVLKGNLHSQNPKGRLYSVILLGTVKEKASCAVGDIGPLLWDTDPQVRFASALTLEKITGKDLLPNHNVENPDPLSADALLADTPEGKYVQAARDWWTAEGSKINWHPKYGACDP